MQQLVDKKRPTGFWFTKPKRTTLLTSTSGKCQTERWQPTFHRRQTVVSLANSGCSWPRCIIIVQIMQVIGQPQPLSDWWWRTSINSCCSFFSRLPFTQLHQVGPDLAKENMQWKLKQDFTGLPAAPNSVKTIQQWANKMLELLSRSWAIMVTRSVRTNKRGGWTAPKHSAFTNSVGLWKYKTWRSSNNTMQYIAH